MVAILNIISGLCITGASLGTLLATAVFLLQEKLLYFPSIPSRRLDHTPADYHLSYRDLRIRTPDALNLHAWLVLHPAAPASAPTLLYFHGNAGNIAHRLTDVQNFIALVQCNVLMLSYRGYGLSDGSPSERGLKIDARTALQACKTELHDVIDTSKLFVFGRSIGGAVALNLAAEFPNEIRGIIVENTFTSINDMIDRVMPVLRPFKFLNRNNWDNTRAIAKTELPILFLSGLQDELVPPEHMTRLYALASHTTYRRMETFKNGTHNDTWYRGGRKYYDAIREFIAKVLAEGGKTT